MPHTWMIALNNYHYPVNLQDFRQYTSHPLSPRIGTIFFNLNIPGDRSSTMMFEERFRKYANQHLEVWAELVFWKNYTRGNFRNKLTVDYWTGWNQRKIKPQDLYNAAQAFITNPDITKR